MEVLLALNTMPDLWETLPAGPPRLLAQAATFEFGKRGYHATTTRHIAERAGMSPAGLYVHYATKAELLFTISQIGHESVLAACLASLESSDDPARRVYRLVRTFTIWHAVNHLLARVIQYEMRSLESEHYQVIASIRRRTEALMSDALQPMMNDPHLRRLRTMAVMSLSIDVARWYSPGKSEAPETLGEAYADMVMQMLGSGQQ